MAYTVFPDIDWQKKVKEIRALPENPVELLGDVGELEIDYIPVAEDHNGIGEGITVARLAGGEVAYRHGGEAFDGEWEFGDIEDALQAAVSLQQELAGEAAAALGVDAIISSSADMKIDNKLEDSAWDSDLDLVHVEEDWDDGLFAFEKGEYLLRNPHPSTGETLCQRISEAEAREILEEEDLKDAEKKMREVKSRYESR